MPCYIHALVYKHFMLRNNNFLCIFYPTGSASPNLSEEHFRTSPNPSTALSAMPFSPHQHSPPQGSMHVQMSPELAQAQMLRDKLSHQYDHQRPPMFGEFKPQFSQSTTSMNQPVSTISRNFS